MAHGFSICKGKKEGRQDFRPGGRETSLCLFLFSLFLTVFCFWSLLPYCVRRDREPLLLGSHATIEVRRSLLRAIDCSSVRSLQSVALNPDFILISGRHREGSQRLDLTPCPGPGKAGDLANAASVGEPSRRAVSPAALVRRRRNYLTTMTCMAASRRAAAGTRRRLPPRPPCRCRRPGHKLVCGSRLYRRSSGLLLEASAARSGPGQ
jgi:hypothetical protein